MAQVSAIDTSDDAWPLDEVAVPVYESVTAKRGPYRKRKAEATSSILDTIQCLPGFGAPCPTACAPILVLARPACYGAAAVCKPP